MKVERTAWNALAAYENYLKKYGNPMDAVFELTCNFNLLKEEVDWLVDKITLKYFNEPSLYYVKELKEYGKSVAR